MTIRERFNALKKQNDKEKLNEFHEKYEQLFKLPAKTLTNEVVKILKEKEQTAKINPVHEVVGNYYEMKKDDEFNKTISTSISIQRGNKCEKITLIQNSTAKDKEDFVFGNYIVDIFDLMLNNNICYAKEIHHACWKAITTNLKEQVLNEIETLNN